MVASSKAKELAYESSFHKQIFDSITNMLKKAETESEIDDIDRKFNLHFPPAEEFFDSGFKRPLTKSYYTNCNKAGLWSLANKFGNPEKFGSLVTLEKVVISFCLHLLECFLNFICFGVTIDWRGPWTLGKKQ